MEHIIYFLQAIRYDNEKVVGTLLKNGANIDYGSKWEANGKNFQPTLSDEVVRRVAISDWYNITVFTSYIIVLAFIYLIGYISFFSGIKCTKILIAGGRGHAKTWPSYILHLRGIFKRFCHGKLNSSILNMIPHHFK